MNEARHKQVQTFKESIGDLVAHDTAVMNMPRIRITAPKNNPKQRGPKLSSGRKVTSGNLNLGGA